MEKTRYNITPNFSDYEQEQLEKPLSVKQWMLTIIVMVIPLVNIVMFFVWAFGKGNRGRANYFKAQLLLTLIITVLGIVSVLVLGALFGSSSGGAY